MRVGFGFDAHRFELGRRLVLGGVTVPFDCGLAGHSDGDVLCHAIADALLGAAGLGDLGSHWPPTEESKGSSSLAFLTVVAALLDTAGYVVTNIDSTVVAESPRLSSHQERMASAIATALHVDAGVVSVKSTTTDGLGFPGRKEGIAAYAAAAISKVQP